jgi:short-subunit dehydrogenase
MSSDVRRTALVTGASSGIGEAFADVFAANGFDLVLTARREDRLRAVAERIRATHGRSAHVIVADLSRRSAPADICESLAARGLAVDALVNNAGFGVPGAFTASAWERHAALMQVMMTAVTELSYRLLPPMVERGYGRIINVASLAGLVPASAGHTLYAASKAFVISFSEALAHEVRSSGVHVTALCPGFTLSEFHDRTGTREIVNQMPAWVWMDAPTVAQQGYEAVMAAVPIYINGRVNRTIFALVKYLPSGIVRPLGRRLSRLYRRAR